MARKRYRYILCGLVGMDDPVSYFRLVAGNMLSDCQAVRIELPENLELNKYSCDPYSTTCSSMKIRELNPMPVVRIDGRFREMPELLNVQPHAWYEELRKRDIHGTVDHGYLSRDRYRAWYRDRLAAAQAQAEAEAEAGAWPATHAT